MRQRPGAGTIAWNCATLVWQHRRRLYAVLLFWAVTHAATMFLVLYSRTPVQRWAFNLFDVDAMAEVRLVLIAADALGEIALALVEAVLVLMLLRRLIGRDRLLPEASNFLHSYWPIVALLLVLDVAFTMAFQQLRTVDLVADREANDALLGMATIALAGVNVWLHARLCLVLPYAVFGEGWQCRKSWRQTSKIWIRLSAMLAVLFFANVLLSTFIWRSVAPAVETLTSYHDWTGTVAGAVVISVKNSLTTTIFLGIVLVVFGRESGRWIAGVRGGPRSPDDMAEVFD